MQLRILARAQGHRLLIATSLIALSLLLAPVAQADIPRVTAAASAVPAHEVRWVVTLSENELEFGGQEGFDTLRFEDCDYLDTPGVPRLPVQVIRLALPTGMRVTEARVARTTTHVLDGVFNVIPSQTPQRISEPLGEFTRPDADVYAQTAPFPANQVELVHQADLSGQSFALLRVCPLRYTPADGTISISTSMEIVLSGTNGYVCGDYLPERASARDRDLCHERLAGLLANPSDIMLAYDPQPAPITRGVSAGDYDYVIITQASWVDDFQPLADWRTKVGSPATIVTTDWIYYSGGYAGTNPDKIRAFVQDARGTWGTKAFLLGGDTNIVPPHVDTFPDVDPEPMPNDTYYGDYDDDWVVEVNVGRAAVRDEAAIATFISKVLTYEKNPPAANYTTSAAFLGFDLNGGGSGEGEDCKIDIKNLYLPAGWTFEREYDSESGGHKSDVIALLNQGFNLVNHIDHCSTYSVGTGSSNHNSHLSPSDMSALTNGNRQSIFYSIGCWACDYDANTCISESFVRNANGGGVALVGNSRYGWYVPYTDDALSLAFDRAFFEALFDNNMYLLGSCFSNHKSTGFGGGQTNCYIFTELTLLGDPLMPIWTAQPEAFVVNHDSSVVAGQSNTFSVTVTDTGGQRVMFAKVCLLKDGEVYDSQYTIASDTVVFNVSPATTGDLHVTVTAQNFLPHESTANVAAPAMHLLSVAVTGDGQVTLDPPGGEYPAGTPVTLLAVPDEGWMLDYWNGALSGNTNPEQLTVNGDLSVTAVFAEDCNGNGVRDDIDLGSGTSTDVNGSGVPDECEPVGDTNCDGNTDVFDIDSFVMAIIAKNDYIITYPNCSLESADCNGDGYSDIFDIDNFITLITN